MIMVLFVCRPPLGTSLRYLDLPRKWGEPRDGARVALDPAGEQPRDAAAAAPREPRQAPPCSRRSWWANSSRTGSTAACRPSLPSGVTTTGTKSTCCARPARIWMRSKSSRPPRRGHVVGRAPAGLAGPGADPGVKPHRVRLRGRCSSRCRRRPGLAPAQVRNPSRRP